MASTLARKAARKPRSSRTAQSGGALGYLGSVVSGVLVSLVVTVIGVAVFALIIRWLSPSQTIVSVVNQALKLISIAVGVWFATRKNADGGLLKGALIGFIYMMLGIVAVSLLTKMPLRLNSYLADLGMGVAGGGLCGMILPGLGKK